MNRIVIAVMLILLSACIVDAARYDFDFESDLNDIIYPDSTEAGGVIIIPRVSDRQYITIASNNTYELTKYDFVRVGASSPSLVIDGDTLIPGETKEMLQLGTYQFHELSDPNKTGTVIVRDIEMETYDISIEYTPSVFDVDLEVDEVATTTEQVIDVMIGISMDVQPGTYRVILEADDGMTTRTIDHDIEVGPYMNSSISSHTFIADANLGNGAEFGHFMIINGGNTISTVKSSISGEISDIVAMQQEFMVFPGVDNKLSVAYNIPATYEVGNYTGIIHLDFDDEDRDEYFNVSLLVKDTIFPKITDIYFTNATVGIPITYSWNATDNSRVSYSKIDWKYQNTGAAVSDTINRTYEGQFSVEKTFALTGDYHYHLCVFDDSLNTNCTDGIVNVAQKDVVRYPESLEFRRQKEGRYSDTFLLNITAPLNLTVALESLEYVPNSTYSVRITSPDNVEKYIDDIGAAVTIDDIGMYRFGFKGDRISAYRGILRLTTNEDHVTFSSVSFSGDIVNYTIPEPIDQEWYGGHLRCIPVDTGMMETSAIECKLSYPIDYQIDKVAIPVTPEDKDSAKRLYEKDVEELEEKIDSNIHHIVVVWIMVVLLISTLLYIILIYPIWRVKIR